MSTRCLCPRINDNTTHEGIVRLAIHDANEEGKTTLRRYMDICSSKQSNPVSALHAGTERPTHISDFLGGLSSTL